MPWRPARLTASLPTGGFLINTARWDAGDVDMSKPAFSLWVFSLYMFALGATLVAAPNILLPLFGVPETHEVWICIAGMLILFIGYLDFMASRHELHPFFAWTIPPRLSVPVILCRLYRARLGTAYPYPVRGYRRRCCVVDCRLPSQRKAALPRRMIFRFRMLHRASPFGHIAAASLLSPAAPRAEQAAGAASPTPPAYRRARVRRVPGLSPERGPSPLRPLAAPRCWTARSSGAPGISPPKSLRSHAHAQFRAGKRKRRCASPPQAGWQACRARPPAPRSRSRRAGATTGPASTAAAASPMARPESQPSSNRFGVSTLASGTSFSRIASAASSSMYTPAGSSPMIGSQTYSASGPSALIHFSQRAACAAVGMYPVRIASTPASQPLLHAAPSIASSFAASMGSPAIALYPGRLDSSTVGRLSTSCPMR